jgi:hypothetical protein
MKLELFRAFTPSRYQADEAIIIVLFNHFFEIKCGWNFEIKLFKEFSFAIMFDKNCWNKYDLQIFFGFIYLSIYKRLKIC